jgi:hypothetical protein
LFVKNGGKIWTDIKAIFFVCVVLQKRFLIWPLFWLCWCYTCWYLDTRQDCLSRKCWLCAITYRLFIYHLFSSIDSVACHFKTYSTETVALCFGYPKTPCLRTGIRVGSCNPSYWEVGILGWFGVGDFVSGYSYHMSVRTGLPDNTIQTKFQSQRPSDVETHVPSIWEQKLSSIGAVSTWMCDRLMGLCSSNLQGKSHREELIQCIALHPHWGVHVLTMSSSQLILCQQ